jgi:UDP-hydrolysing UDP-N-acetyl-D-glucosamine 2-epimerase
MVKRIACIVTSRSSYPRIQTALEAMEVHPGLDVTTYVMQSASMPKYGELVDELPTRAVKVRVYPDPSLTPSWRVSEQLVYLDKVVNEYDVVVTIGDRFETLATAIAATYNNVPLCHIQGGELSGNLDNKVRHAITQMADLHLVATEDSASRVKIMLRDPLAPVFVTGCPSIDLCARIVPSSELAVMGLYHPDTNVNGRVTEKALGVIRGLRTEVTRWYGPNIDPGNEEIVQAVGHWNDSADVFLGRLAGTSCLVGNSSSGIREASYFGTPVVNIGQRQQGRERGPNVVDVGYDVDEIRGAVESQSEHGRYPSSDLYGDGAAGWRIAHLLGEWNP